MGIGTAINVLAGGSIGTLAGAKLPEGMHQAAMQTMGIVTLLVGVSNLLKFDATSTQPVLTLIAVR